MTRGPVGKQLVLFAIPLLLGSLVQQLYNTVDLMFVGNFINSSASAAIGASSLLITCLIGFFGGMSVGSGVVISQIFGAGDMKKLSRAIHNTAALCIAGGIILIFAGYLLAPVYLHVIRTPDSIQRTAVSYLRIYFLSFFSVIFYNFGSGALRALGDSKSPLYAQLIGGLTNVVMDYIFIRLFNNGVNGVAWATLISQSVAAAVIIRQMYKLDPQYAFRPKKIAFDRLIMKKVIDIGLPAGTQALVITLSNVVVQYHINGFGEDAIAAFTAYFKVELIVYLPIVAFGQAMMTFAGQNMGAGRWQRVRQGTRTCTLLSMALAAATSLLALPCGMQLFRIFNKEVAVILLGQEIIRTTFPFYFVYSVLQVVGDSMRGVGKSRVPMLIVLINICLIRSALLFIIVPHTVSLRGVAMVYPITWTLTSICMVVYYFWFHNGREGQKESIESEAISCRH